MRGLFSYFRNFLFLFATVMSMLPAPPIQNPALSITDLFRIRLNKDHSSDIKGIRFGVWSFCRQWTFMPELEGNCTICDIFSPCDLEGPLHLCSEPKYGYKLSITAHDGSDEPKNLSPAWTRALMAHTAVAIMIVICSLRLAFGRLYFPTYMITALTGIVALCCDAAVDARITSLTRELRHVRFAERCFAGPGVIMQCVSIVWLETEIYLAFRAGEIPGDI